MQTKNNVYVNLPLILKVGLRFFLCSSGIIQTNNNVYVNLPLILTEVQNANPAVNTPRRSSRGTRIES